MNIIIFLLGGALCGAAMVHIELQDYLNLLVIYLFLLLVRGTLFFGSRPLLKWLSHDNLPVTLSDAAVMTWGGLRGAVGLALAIQVRRGRAPDSDGVPQIDSTTADRVLFFVSGVAFLTTVVNATSAPYLVQELGITAVPEVQERVLRKFNEQLVNLSKRGHDPPEVTECLQHMLHHIDEELHERSGKCQKSHARVENAKNQAKQMKDKFWGSGVIQQMKRKSIRPPLEAQAVSKAFLSARMIFESIPDEDKGRMDHLPCSLAELAQDSEEMMRLIESQKAEEEMCKVITKTFMNLVFTNYHKFIQAGDLRPGSPETDVLFTSIRVCLSPLTAELTDLDFVMHSITDNRGVIGHVSEENKLPPELAEQYSKLGKSIVLRAKSVTEHQSLRDSVAPRPSLNKINMSDDGLEDDIILAEGDSMHAKLDRFVKSQPFALGCVCAILLNAIYVAADEIVRDSKNDKHPLWLVCEWLFCVVFAAEAAIKISHSRQKYFKDGFNKFDFFLVLLGIVGAITSTMSFTSDEEMTVEGSNEGRIIRISRVLRTMRFLRIFRLFHARLSADKFVSRELAVCMHKMQTLTCFVHGHILAQKQLTKYFMGDRENIKDVEIARCILQSQASVHKALISIISVQRTMDTDLLDELHYTKERKRIVENLEAFVQDATDEGAISSKDAHAILHPMHAEIATCLNVINKRTDGFVNRKLEDSGSAPVAKAVSTFVGAGTAKDKGGRDADAKAAAPGLSGSSKSPRPAANESTSPQDRKEQALREVIGNSAESKSAGYELSQLQANGSQLPSLHQADSAGGLSLPAVASIVNPGEERQDSYDDLLRGENQESGPDGLPDDRRNSKKIRRKVKKGLPRSNSKGLGARGSEDEPGTSGLSPLLEDTSASPAQAPLEGILERPASPPTPEVVTSSSRENLARLSKGSLF